jgi:glycosyltransferase involved in cell wall biosynthesis
MDNMPFFYNDKMKITVREKEKELCILAQDIITSSVYLKNKINNDYKVDNIKISVIKNAADISIIDDQVLDLGLKHPNMIYIGTIGSWFDIDVINEFCTKNPQVTVYLVGPIDRNIKKRLKKIDNITLEGPVEHSYVKSYISEADVLLIPFKINEIVKGVDPVKVYEYITMNKSIISSYWREMECYKNNIHFYYNYNSFIEGYNKIIEINKNKKNSNLNIEFFKENNWIKRVNEYLKIINKDNNY